MDAEHLILGAGCAGLALAAALVDAGVREEIVLLERRTDFENDRTWCFWDTGDIPWAQLATRRWDAWNVMTGAGAHVRRAGRIPYAHLPADVYAEALLTRLGRAPNVHVRTGVAVKGVQRDGESVRVQTHAGELRAARAYDALGGGGPLAGAAEPASALRQRFLGQEVRTERPVFDPMVATLMDFRVGQEDGVHFVYVLPFTAHSALVEDTHIGTVATAPAARRATIARYLEDVYGTTDFSVGREERGSLPMSTRGHPAEPLPGVWSVGTAAGAVRPSSGYAFARIQRHATELARAVASGASSAPGASGQPTRTRARPHLPGRARPAPGRVPRAVREPRRPRPGRRLRALHVRRLEPGRRAPRRRGDPDAAAAARPEVSRPGSTPVGTAMPRLHSPTAVALAVAGLVLLAYAGLTGGAVIGLAVETFAVGCVLLAPYARHRG